MTRLVSYRGCLLLALVGVCALFMLGSLRFHLRYQSESFKGTSLAKESRLGSAVSRLDKTAVVYIYHESNPIYARNLEFFMKVAIGKDPHPLVDYYIIVNGEVRLVDLSKLPSNVALIYRENTCFDGGAVGILLESYPKLWTYRYFVLVNSSVRGPFLPRYFPSNLPWTAALTNLISDHVKLVGTTISCQGQVHVQSMVMATDSIGLRILYEADALTCPKTLIEAITFYEYGSTTAIFERGYTIDCLMTRYKGVDWRVNPKMHCNDNLNPQLDLRNDGQNLDPFEVLFVKVKEFPLVSNSDEIRHYTSYFMGNRSISASDFFSPKVQKLLKSEKAALYDRAKRCKAVFDAEYYLKMNPDLSGVMPTLELVKHFDYAGFEERRAFRYIPDGRHVARDRALAKVCTEALLGQVPYTE